jgi:hypothetical protein
MFVRVESGFKAEFSDPEASRIHHKIAELHSSLADKVRWIRKLKVVWMELDAPRDKVVQAIQHCFKNKVTDWVFTGDLLPSAAGASGTLYDLMQESPFRPGVFHGIEKRKRLSAHDEEAQVICDAMQTILGRKSPQDRVVTGELLLVEGAKLSQSDLEWIARNWFAQDRTESWSLLSEEELKRNSRFQSEQVGKYLMNPQQASRSRLLQFRANTRGVEQDLDWNAVESLFGTPEVSDKVSAPLIQGDEWNFRPDMRFSSAAVNQDALTETEFQLCRHQLDHFTKQGAMRLQTVLAVLPEKNRLWRSEIQGDSPLRIRDDFETAIERVAESTDTPIAVMKVLEELNENAPAYFWTSSISTEDSRFGSTRKTEASSVVDLVYVGFQDQTSIRNLTYFENLKMAYLQALRGESLAFSIEASGRSLLQCLRSAPPEAQYGFDLVVDGVVEWFKRALRTPLSLGFVWGVSSEKREWLFSELRSRGIPFTHFGSTSLTGDVRVFEGGEVRAKVNIQKFFKKEASDPQALIANLLDEPVFVSENRVQPKKFRNRFSTEELIIKPELYHMSVASPLVIRPDVSSWGGLVVLADLVGQEFSDEYIDYVLRKCTAMGGQIQSIQVSYVNGLKSWSSSFKKLEREFGISVLETEAITHPEIGAHWMAFQVVSKVSDVRTVRTEEFKFVNDRIYWLPGDFEQASTRWLAGFEGRYQTGLHSAVAIEVSEEGPQSVINALTYALVKRRLGAEVKIQHHFPGGFFVSVSENERFAVEEEWRVVGVEFEFVGRVTSSPYLVIRNEEEQVQTIAIEDIL